MKTIALLVGCLLMVAPATPQKTQDDLQLPVLHKIMRATLSPNYGCRSAVDFHKGYANTALFLSAYSRERNSPELLFNGACKSPDYFEAQTAGDDLDVITDYGDIPLTRLAGSHLFSPERRTDSVAVFAARTKPQVGHTYGMLLNKREIRGFFFFRVIAYVPNQKVDLEYVVMDYQVSRVLAQSPGFNWDEKSVY